jgi:ribosomal protein S18 acetylase RimI-like enzyme
MKIGDYEQAYTLWQNTPNVGLNNHDDTRDGIAKYLARNPDTCFVAEEGSRIIGVMLGGHDGRRGYIYHAAVDGGAQRHGVGSALLDAVMGALGREGISKVALVAFEKNEKGNAFWEKQGFASRNDLVYRNKSIIESARIDT